MVKSMEIDNQNGAWITNGNKNQSIWQWFFFLSAQIP
jgi:hypothetical protein